MRCCFAQKKERNKDREEWNTRGTKHVTERIRTEDANTKNCSEICSLRCHNVMPYGSMPDIIHCSTNSGIWCLGRCNLYSCARTLLKFILRWREVVEANFAAHIPSGVILLFPVWEPNPNYVWHEGPQMYLNINLSVAAALSALKVLFVLILKCDLSLAYVDRSLAQYSLYFSVTTRKY